MQVVKTPIQGGLFASSIIYNNKLELIPMFSPTNEMKFIINVLDDVCVTISLTKNEKKLLGVEINEIKITSNENDWILIHDISLLNNILKVALLFIQIPNIFLHINSLFGFVQDTLTILIDEIVFSTDDQQLRLTIDNTKGIILSFEDNQVTVFTLDGEGTRIIFEVFQKDAFVVVGETNIVSLQYSKEINSMREENYKFFDTSNPLNVDGLPQSNYFYNVNEIAVNRVINFAQNHYRVELKSTKIFDITLLHHFIDSFTYFFNKLPQDVTPELCQPKVDHCTLPFKNSNDKQVMGDAFVFIIIRGISINNKNDSILNDPSSNIEISYANNVVGSGTSISIIKAKINGQTFKLDCSLYGFNKTNSFKQTLQRYSKRYFYHITPPIQTLILGKINNLTTTNTSILSTLYQQLFSHSTPSYEAHVKIKTLTFTYSSISITTGNSLLRVISQNNQQQIIINPKTIVFDDLFNFKLHNKQSKSLVAFQRIEKEMGEHAKDLLMFPDSRLVFKKETSVLLGCKPDESEEDIETTLIDKCDISSYGSNSDDYLSNIQTKDITNDENETTELIETKQLEQGLILHIDSISLNVLIQIEEQTTNGPPTFEFMRLKVSIQNLNTLKMKNDEKLIYFTLDSNYPNKCIYPVYESSIFFNWVKLNILGDQKYTTILNKFTESIQIKHNVFASNYLFISSLKIKGFCTTSINAYTRLFTNFNSYKEEFDLVPVEKINLSGKYREVFDMIFGEYLKKNSYFKELLNVMKCMLPVDRTTLLSISDQTASLVSTIANYLF
ncbi:Chorein N-terminal domain-containing protein [Entamoeba marina]